VTTIAQVISRMPAIPLATPQLRCAHAFASLHDAWAEANAKADRRLAESVRVLRTLQDPKEPV